MALAVGTGVLLVLASWASGWADGRSRPALSVRLDPLLQARAQAMAGERSGTAALVLDLRSRSFVSVVHAETALCSALAPGSLVKIVTAVALLDSGLASGHEQVTCRDEVSLWGRTFTCGRQGGHGAVAMRTALGRSCSVWFYSMGQRLAREQFRGAARVLGLEGDERPCRAARVGRLRPGPSRRAFTLALAGEGPGVTLAPWQVALMVERIAAVDPSRSPLSLLARKTLQAALREAVQHGTAAPAALARVEVAGKTGTAEVHAAPDVSGRDARRPRLTHGWFAGYAPAEAPQVAVVVFMHRGDGQAAAALGGRLLQAALERGRP